MNRNKLAQWLLLTFCCVGLFVAGCDMEESAKSDPKIKTAETAETTTTTATVKDQTITPKPPAPESSPKPVPVEPKTPVTPSTTVLAGKLSVNKLIYDFGQVEPSKKVKGEYILTNSGKGVLEIVRPVKSSCGCTVPELKTYILQPGESVPLVVTFKAPDHPGKTSKTITVITKSPSSPKSTTLKITAEIIRHITVTPTRLELHIRKDSPNREIVLNSFDGQPFSVVGFTSTGNALKLIFDKNTKAKRHVLPIQINLDRLRQQQRGSLVVRVDHPKVKSISVFYQSLKPFAAKPATRYFSKAKPGQSINSTVTIISNFGEPFELDQVRSEKGHVEILSTTKSPDGYRIDFTLKIPKDQKSGIIRDHLLIDIKNRKDDPIKVICYARVQ